MIRTPKYKLPFFQQGDFYSAQADLERMIITDNELQAVSEIVGDGVLSGWTVCHVEKDGDPTTLELEIQPGSGFINNIFHRTLSIKRKLVQNNISTLVYMQSRMINLSGGLNIETESAVSNTGTAIFVDTTPPAVPTGLAGVSPEFDLINLFWNANSEVDFDHYLVFRSLFVGGPYVQISAPFFNGVSPNLPFQDKNLSEATTYFYQLKAVDKSGNTSAASAPISVTTLPDTTKPAESAGVSIFPSNTTASVLWKASPTPNVQYRIILDRLNPDGSVLSTSTIDNLTSLYYQLTGLINGTQYRLTLVVKRTTIGGPILSNGVVFEFTPVNSNAPLDPLLDLSAIGTAVIPISQAVTLNWLPSPTPTGTSIAQKKEYIIRVVDNGVESAPIKNIGLVSTKTINSFRFSSSTNFTQLQPLVDNTVYLFRISTIDVFGNESAGLFLKGTTLDVTPPADPRNLVLTSGDGFVKAFWKHSPDSDVSNYVLSIDTGSGPVVTTIGYLTSHKFTGLANGTSATVNVKAKDASGNISSPGITASISPVADTTPPAVPSGVKAVSEDTQVSLTWDLNGEEDFAFYNIKRIAITQSLPVAQNQPIVERTEVAKPVAGGQITTIFNGDPVVAAFQGLPSMVGNVFVVFSGKALGQKSTISAFNSGTGRVTLATPLTAPLGVGDTVAIRLTHPSLGTVIRNIGTAHQILDFSLLNGQVYAYYIQAVDQKGNASAFSDPVFVAPTCGLNDLSAPLNLTISPSGSNINLAWDQIIPDADHPAINHNAFNIYRSQNQFVGFELISSVPAKELSATVSSVVSNSIFSSSALIGNTSLVGKNITMRSGPANTQQSLILSANSLTGQITLSTPFSIAPSIGDNFDIANLTYTDSNLLNNITYYYVVTAVRDDADAIIDTGAIQPPNSVLLATVKLTPSSPLGCSITAIQNQQRLLGGLSATIGDETKARLLTHHHTGKPLNSITVTAAPALAAIDAALLATFKFDGLNLAPNSLLYYKSLISDKNGKTIVYDTGTTYVISPSSIVGNVPFAGDFQVLVNGNATGNTFIIDENRNAIVFSSSLSSADIVLLDGTQFNYYIPAIVDLDDVGFDIKVNGVSVAPSVDEGLQTIRFLQPLGASDVVTVVIEPSVPVFSTQLPTQINLSPNLVLSDFTTQNGKLFQSLTGAFGVNDVFFVLVNGVRTSIPHFVDAVKKQIIFDISVPSTSTVALEVLNKEEVQGLLPPEKITGIEASSFKTGAFIKPQLPKLDHEGRIKESALPIFQTLSTNNKYSYQAAKGIVGSGTTPYSIYQFDDGSILLGTSSGLMKAGNFSAFNGEGDSNQAVIDYSINPPSGLKFTSVTPDKILTQAKLAVSSSGRVTASVQIPLQNSSIKEVQGSTLTILDNGKVLIVGGQVFFDARGFFVESALTYLYDPVTLFATPVASLNNRRAYHASTLLPDGRVLVTGGSQTVVIHNDPQGTPDFFQTVRLTSAEIYDPLINSWVLAPSDMSFTRDFHSMSVINDSEILVTGGNTGISSYSAVVNPPTSTPPATTKESELYTIGSGVWRQTASLNKTRVDATVKVDKGVFIISGGGQPGRELYDRGNETWTYEGQDAETIANTLSSQFGVNSIDGPVKQFLKDSFGLLLLATRNNVYATDDQGQTFVKTKGLESIGVVHRIAQSSNGTLYAATDLGVYEITPDIHSELTWFQGGLIGSGTTETFDLQAYNDLMLAATEIGIFYTTSVQNGDIWTQLNQDGTIFENVYNIEAVSTLLFLQSGSVLYRSDNSGLNWTKVANFSFLDQSARLIARSPLDLFFATSTGLYATRDGVSFFLVDFDKNRHPSENNCQMADVIGTDLLVGYDNVIFSLDPNFQPILISEFVGTVPTVLVNGTEVRRGFRYNTKTDEIIFEFKQFANDVVEATSNYGIYNVVNGPWYSHNVSAAVTVYVNGKIQPDEILTLDARLGQITFTNNLFKTDKVTVDIIGTTLKNEGEFFHSELEDKFEEENGLPLSLGRDYSGDLLQMGLSIEHNFWERGLERNQYYCLQGSMVDRSLTSFQTNAEYYIMGRREFNRFDSTIDYTLQSEQSNIGRNALLPLSALEVVNELWVGTENGIFALNTSSSNLQLNRTLQVGPPNNSIKDLNFFSGDVWAITNAGIFTSDDNGASFVKNPGNGLPDRLFTMCSLNNVIIIGTNDGIYYCDQDNLTPPYSVWFKATFVEGTKTQQLFVTEPCYSFTVGRGAAYAGIGRGVYISIDGKAWSHIFDFPIGIVINKLVFYANQLFVGTNQGVYSDDGSARSPNASFKLQFLELTLNNQFATNDLFVATDGNVTSLYAVGNRGNVYHLANQVWSKTQISGISAIQKFVIVTGPKQIAFSNDLIFVQ